MASPAGLDSTVSCAMAHLKMVRILCRTRLAVSGRVVHIGVRTASTSVRPIVSTGMLPIFGKAWCSRVWIQDSACFWFLHRGLFASWTI